MANVVIGGGWSTSVFNTTGVTGATPTAVSPGKVAGFYLFAHNSDSANLSSFFLTASTASNVTPKGAFWSHSQSGPWTACDISSGLKCTFGTFNSGETVYVVAALTLPNSTAASTANCFTDPNREIQPPYAYGVDPTGATWECVDFQFAANSGYVPGKNKSRGDAYHWFDAVNTDTGPDQAAQFPFCDLSSSADCNANLLTISDNQSLDKTNPQWTQVTVRNDRALFNSGQSVADGAKVPQSCPDGFETECATAFLGQWSQVDVNFGEDSSEWFQVDIGMYGVSASKINEVLHFYQDRAGGWHVEVIDDLCADASGPASLLSDPCFWVSPLHGSSSKVTVWTHHNGKFGIG